MFSTLKSGAVIPSVEVDGVPPTVEWSAGAIDELDYSTNDETEIQTDTESGDSDHEATSHVNKCNRKRAHASLETEDAVDVEDGQSLPKSARTSYDMVHLPSPSSSTRKITQGKHT